MQFSVRHWIPGRIRLHVPALGSNTPATGKVVAWLAAQDGISGARVNHACATLVVTYDETRRALIERMLAYLVWVSPRDLVTLVDADEPDPPSPAVGGGRQVTIVPATVQAPDTIQPLEPAATPAKPPPKLGPSVLALPTLSLALAFSGNPLAHRGQRAADALERGADRQARLGHLEPGTAAECRLPRYAGDRRLDRARRITSPAASSPG